MSPLTTEEALTKTTTPDKKLEQLFIVLSRKLQDTIEKGGIERQWAENLQNEAYEEVFGK